jgi:hypothetical protein
LFWNIRDFGRLARRRQNKDYIKEEFLDGIGLQETMKEYFTQRELEAISGEFKWVCKGARGHSGGGGDFNGDQGGLGHRGFLCEHGSETVNNQL